MRSSIQTILAILILSTPGWSIEPAPEGGIAPAGPAAAVVSTEERGRAYGHLMRSMVSVRRGEVGAAVEEIHRALELVPDSPDLLTESAELLLSWTARVAEAERLARRAREIDPEHRGALRLLADLGAARALGSERDEASRNEAIELYEWLAEGADEREQAELLRTLVQLRLQAGDAAGALLDVRRLVASRPGDLRATQTLAQLLLRSGQETGALETLLGYVVEHPQQEDLMGWAEQLANGVQGWPAVVQSLGAHAPFREDAPALNRFYGEALLRVGRAADAAEVLERAGAVRPQDSRIRKDLALAYRGMGRLADAAQLFAALVRDAPGHPLLQQLLAETLESQNDVHGALESYRTALAALVDRQDVVPGYRDGIRQRIALIYLGQALHDEARTTLDEMEVGDNPFTLEIGCRLAIATRSWDEARKLARRLAEAGEAGKAAGLEGEIAVGEKKWTKARARFEEAIRLLGPDLRASFAEAYREAGRPDDGLQLLLDWKEAAPDLADARFHLGVYYYELDRFADAERELREAFRLDPRHARALNFLGYSLAERSMRLDEALGMIERALEIDSWNGAYLDSLGWVYYRMGRFEEARPPLERAVRELPKDPVVLEHLGDLYLSLGDSRGAGTAWNRALEASPEDPEALRGKIRDIDTGERFAAEDGLR